MLMTRSNLSLKDITIRTELRPGDIGYLTYLHGTLYNREYAHGTAFEAYVAHGLAEFYQQYHPEKDRAWICEHGDRIVGSLFLMHRKQAAQLRYFLIHPKYRGLGLGKRLMELYMDFLYACGYSASYLWTTHELEAAASLYTRHGFALAEERPSSRFGKPVIEQKYEWRRELASHDAASVDRPVSDL